MVSLMTSESISDVRTRSIFRKINVAGLCIMQEKVIGSVSAAQVTSSAVKLVPEAVSPLHRSQDCS